MAYTWGGPINENKNVTKSDYDVTRSGLQTQLHGYVMLCYVSYVRLIGN